MQTADPPAFKIFGINVTEKPDLRGQHLNSLLKLILSMNFLNTNDVVVLGKSSEVDVLFSLECCGENRDPRSPLVFQVTHRKLNVFKMFTICIFPRQ